MNHFNALRSAAGLVLAVAAFGSPAKADSFDYSSVAGAKINFNGNSTFSFSPSGTGTSDFRIVDGTGAGLLGEVSGTFTIGTVTKIGLTSSAPVTGTGSVVLYDGVTDLTASLTWVSIFQRGTGDTLNDMGTVDLTHISYSGTNPDFLALARGTDPTNALTFQFVPAKTLAQLKTTRISTSFSGTFGYTPVPESASTALFTGLGLIALGAARFGRRGAARLNPLSAV